MPRASSPWNARERALQRGLSTPLKVQRYLDATPYSSDPIYRCPRRVMTDRRAHCVDGALFAAAALRFHGHDPVVCWINAEQDDGHLLALFRRGSLWGAVAKSNFVGLRYREPVYRSLRELVMSYFNDYFNAAGYRSMRSYTRPLDLSRFDKLNWMTTQEGVPPVVDDALDRLATSAIAPAKVIRSLTRIDSRTLKAGMLGVNKAGLFKPTQEALSYSPSTQEIRHAASPHSDCRALNGCLRPNSFAIPASPTRRGPR